MSIFARIIAALEKAEKAKESIFDDFVDAHPGVEHIDSASKGGTFFLVGGLLKGDVSDDSPWSIRHGDTSTGPVDVDDGDDTFEFGDFDAGTRTDEAFDVSGDSGASDFGEIVVTRAGLDTTIGPGADSIALLGVDPSDLNANDFIL